MTMLYKSPGKESIWGVSVDYQVFPESDLEQALSEGWNKTVHGAEQDAKDLVEAELKANEAALTKVEQKLSTLKAVHKGAGKWEVQDAEGNVLASGLTKEEAHAQAG